jgi:hypothetical protein
MRRDVREMMMMSRVMLRRCWRQPKYQGDERTPPNELLHVQAPCSKSTRVPTSDPHLIWEGCGSKASCAKVKWVGAPSLIILISVPSPYFSESSFSPVGPAKRVVIARLGGYRCRRRCAKGLFSCRCVRASSCVASIRRLGIAAVAYASF